MIWETGVVRIESGGSKKLEFNVVSSTHESLTLLLDSLFFFFFVSLFLFFEYIN